MHVQVDRGWYMCQVNTDPMRSQKGYIEVQVPPSIVDTRSSTDLVVREKEKVRGVVGSGRVLVWCLMIDVHWSGW